MDTPFKILFIKPSRGKGLKIIDVPLAFLYLSSCLKKHLAEPVGIELLDLRLTRKTGRALQEKLDAFQPDLIGISLLAEDRCFLNEWSRFLRTRAPAAKIVIGGPAATHEYDELLLNNDSVDWAVIGEGEIVFLNLVRALIRGEAVGRLDGLACVDRKKVVRNPGADFIVDLDTLPFPDYSLVNLPAYFSPLNYSYNGFLHEKRYVPVMSSRGCPFHCIYCHDIFGKKVRKRTPLNFIEEIQWLYDVYGIREFHVIDDIFNIDRKRMHTILNLIVESDMNIKLAFPNGLRADMLEKEDIALLQRAGAYALSFAIESASPRVQRMIGKNLNLDKALENIEYAGSIGLIVRGFFMLGFPGETAAEMKSTILLARKSSLDLASFFIPIPFKGTDLFRLVEKISPGLMVTVRGDFWDENTFYRPATGYDIKKAHINATLRFYSPFRIIKVLRKLPNKLHIINFFRSFLLILLNRTKTERFKS